MKLTSISTRLWLMLGLFFLGILAAVYLSLNDNRQVIENSYRDNTRHVTEIAKSILQHFHQRQLNGELSQQEAQAQALAVISAIRFDQSNYIFMGDDAGISISNGIQELVGTNIMGMRDPTGQPMVRDLYDAAARGGGFVDYQWPDIENKHVLLPKTSYADYFAPWRWTLGSGLNTDDMEQKLAGIQKSSLINLSLIMGLISLLILFFTRRVNRQSQILLQSMAHLASGQADLRRRLPTAGGQEIAELSASYNRLTASLEEMVLQIQQDGIRFLAAADTARPTRQLPAADAAPTLEQARYILHQVCSHAEYLQQSHATLKLMAEQDPMTGLLCQQAFDVQVREQLAGLDADTPGVLVLIGFDSLIDIHHAAFTGQANLVTGVLRHQLPEEVSVCFIPDKGFAYWIGHIDGADSMRLALVLLQQLNQELTEGQSISIGLSAALGDTKSYEQLFSEAERALIRAQRDGGSRVYEY